VEAIKEESIRISKYLVSIVEAHRIRKFGGMFYVIFGYVSLLFFVMLMGFANFSSFEKYLFELCMFNSILILPVILYYCVFIYYFWTLGIISHELGHAIAMRYYGIERIAIVIFGWFWFYGMCLGCVGEDFENSEIIPPAGDAISDFAGGVLCCGMLLVVYALTQSLGILIMFSILATYSAFETKVGYGDSNLVENIFNGNGIFLLNELTERDVFKIQEELYINNPT
jgi:hypothetical protein